MNIEMANKIPLSQILVKIGLKIVKVRGHDIWYHSPFRHDKTASFHIHTNENVWYDFGEVKGGDVVNFACAFLDSQGRANSTADALRWLNDLMGSNKNVPALQLEPATEHPKALEIRKLSTLESPSLLNYLRKRGINLQLAKRHLREATVYNSNTGKEFQTLALPNESEGFELRNAFFKGCIAPKGITFIRGSKVLPDEIHVFEGVMDYLSAVSYQKDKRFEGDAIILNSVICLPQAYPYIKNYSYKTVRAWFDNDHVGDKTTVLLQKFAFENGMGCISMACLYSKFKDVNEWHMQKRGMTSAP
jgi:hypothetical protein